MTLAEFVEFIKREKKYGDYLSTAYTDQATKDIIASLNKRSYKFWRKWYWDWNINELSQSVAANASSITLATADAQILLLTIQGKVGSLRPMSFKYYMDWKKTSTDEPGTPKRYIRLGYTSAGLIKIKPWPTPSEAFTLEGWTRPMITKYSVTDIAANTGIAYFPNHVQDILQDGVMADISLLSGDKDMFKVHDNDFDAGIELLIGEEQRARPDEDPPNVLPSYIRRRQHLRGQGTGNY